MPSNPSRTGLVLLTGVSLLSWAIAGYAFVQRDDMGARLAQAEAAKTASASDIEHAQAATAQAAELKQKLADAQAALATSQAQTTELTQKVTTLTADVAARTQERDALAAQVKAAPASAPSAPVTAAATPAAKPQPHKTTH